jgi:hypothetical protein
MKKVASAAGILMAGLSTALGQQLSNEPLDAELLAEHQLLERTQLLASTKAHVAAMHQACTSSPMEAKSAASADEAAFCGTVAQVLRSLQGEDKLLPRSGTEIAAARAGDPDPD